MIWIWVPVESILLLVMHDGHEYDFGNYIHLGYSRQSTIKKVMNPPHRTEASPPWVSSRTRPPRCCRGCGRCSGGRHRSPCPGTRSCSRSGRGCSPIIFIISINIFLFIFLSPRRPFWRGPWCRRCLGPCPWWGRQTLCRWWTCSAWTTGNIWYII